MIPAEKALQKAELKRQKQLQKERNKYQKQLQKELEKDWRKLQITATYWNKWNSTKRNKRATDEENLTNNNIAASNILLNELQNDWSLLQTNHRNLEYLMNNLNKSSLSQENIHYKNNQSATVTLNHHVNNINLV